MPTSRNVRISDLLPTASTKSMQPTPHHRLQKISTLFLAGSTEQAKLKTLAMMCIKCRVQSILSRGNRSHAWQYVRQQTTSIHTHIHIVRCIPLEGVVIFGHKTSFRPPARICTSEHVIAGGIWRSEEENPSPASLHDMADISRRSQTQGELERPIRWQRR